MTPNAPTWGEIEAFLQVDRWRQIPAGTRGGRGQKHVFFEKVLPDGRALQTHVSHSRSGRPSPNRFALILRQQLEVSRDEFWTALEHGKAVKRPVALDGPVAVEHPAGVVAVLARDLHMSAAEISSLTAEDAEALVTDYWSRPDK